MENQNSNNANKFMIPTVVAALLVFAAVGFYIYNSNKPQSKVSGIPEQIEQTQMEAQNERGGEYKDGEYKVVGEYLTPGGPKEVSISLTLSNGDIIEAAAEVLAPDATSKRFQTDFVENFKSQVIGKNIDEIVLSKVSGSSLTPKGFNDAVEKIKVEAGV